MSLLRQSAFRSLTTARAVRFSPRAFSIQTTRQAQQGYGDPKGNPTSSNPQDQGKNPQVGKEHPGPDAPSAAKQSSGSSSKPSTSSSSGATSSNSQSEPDTSPEAVKKHNEELENRNEKTAGDDGEKVDPKFWKGHGDDKPQ